MKLKVLLSFFILIFQCQLLAAETISPPKFVKTGGIDGFIYWVTKKLLTDIDETLKKQGIDPAVCTFRPRDGSADLSYRDLGQCLMKNFEVAMNTDPQPGVIYAWIRDLTGNFHLVEISWTPPRGGWKNFIRQVLEMKFEGAFFRMRKLIWNQERADRVNFKEFIMGELKIILPTDPTVLETLSFKGSNWAKRYLKDLKSLSFKLDTQSKTNGQMVYSGPMVMELRSSSNDETKILSALVTTNVNILLMDRRDPMHRPGDLEIKSLYQKGTEFIEMEVAP